MDKTQVTELNQNELDHRVVFLGFDRIQLLDLAGPLETLQIANEAPNGSRYSTSIVSQHEFFKSESGIQIKSDYTFAQLDNRLDTPFRINTLVIPG